MCVYWSNRVGWLAGLYCNVRMHLYRLFPSQSTVYTKYIRNWQIFKLVSLVVGVHVSLFLFLFLLMMPVIFVYFVWLLFRIEHNEILDRSTNDTFKPVEYVSRNDSSSMCSLRLPSFSFRSPFLFLTHSFTLSPSIF